MQKKHILSIAVTLLIVSLDQASKAWILSTLAVGEFFPVVDGLFNIAHVRNPGAAFGFLAGASPAFRTLFFGAATAAAILLILWYLREARMDDLPLVSSLSLILAGAVGNLIDRVRFGEVVDFLDVYVGRHHWPAFNVADAAISTGAVLLMVLLLRRGRGRGEEGR